MQSQEKIFGIGLSKTGTTSLAVALHRLGFATRHMPLDWHEFSRYQAFSDSSVAVSFQQLDKRFPGSKFIYTVRDEETWLRSCKRHFSKKPTRKRFDAVRLRLYGCTRYDEVLFRAAYHWHDLKIRRHFRKRESSLLILNIVEEGDLCWERLCAFLDRPNPGVQFPWKKDASRGKSRKI